MRVDELVDGILVGIGDRDAAFAIKDAHVTDGVHTTEVGDERTVDALELLAGQTALQSLEVGEGRDLTALCEMETHIVVHASQCREYRRGRCGQTYSQPWLLNSGRALSGPATGIRQR